MHNHVFSDLASADGLSCEISETVAKKPAAWRKGYSEKPRSWEDPGPGPGDTNPDGCTKSIGSRQAPSTKTRRAPEDPCQCNANACQEEAAACRLANRRGEVIRFFGFLQHYLHRPNVCDGPYKTGRKPCPPTHPPRSKHVAIGTLPSFSSVSSRSLDHPTRVRVEILQTYTRKQFF